MLGSNLVNTIVGILTADVLFSGAYNEYRDKRKLAKEAEALVQAHPDIDDVALNKECE